MKFRNYCAVIMGKFDKELITEELKKITESQFSSIDTGGIMIATFTSVLEPSELGETLKTFNVNYMVFDLDVKTTSVHLNNPMLHDGLFGLINNVTNNDLEDMSSRLLRDISLSSTTTNHRGPRNTQKVKKVKNLGPSEEDIKKMSKDEKEALLNKYIDSGLENLTESDKKIIELLAK